MTRLLVLVDRDTRWGKSNVAELAIPWDPDGSACVVFALHTNVGTARPRFDAEAREIIQRLCVGVPDEASVRIEVTFVLNVPEAADAALYRLFLTAPSARAPRDFDHVVLLCRDGDLREAVKRTLKPRPHRVGHTYAWAVGAIGSPQRAVVCRRAAPAVPAAHRLGALARTCSEQGRLTEVLWSRQLAERSADLPVEPRDLDELLSGVEQHPWWLSQVSVTDEAVSGVERGRALLAGSPRVALCPSAGEGVEVTQIPTSRREEYDLTQVEASSVGNGAVTAAAGEVFGTWRTSLPASVVRASPRRRTLPRSSRLRDAAILGGLCNGTRWCRVPGAQVKVDFTRTDDLLRCCITNTTRQPPRLWWVDHQQALSSKANAPNGSRLCPRPVEDVVAEAFVTAGPELGLCSPVGDEPVHLTCFDGPIVAAEGSDGARYAVLLPPDVTESVIRCSPIQTLSIDALATQLRTYFDDAGTFPDGALRRLAKALWRMPLVVVRP